MATIYLVRHGEATAHWSEAHDAELSELGHRQAAIAAEALAMAHRRGPSAILSSPLRRARATAAPLEALWKMSARLEAAVAEIPTQGGTQEERTAWLNGLATGGWKSADRASRDWRQGVVDFVANLNKSTVIYTHFVAINAVLGAALERDDVYLFRPANGSITVIENDRGG